MKTLRCSILLPIIDFSQLLHQDYSSNCQPTKQRKEDHIFDPYSEAINALQSESDICQSGRYEQIIQVNQYLSDFKNGTHERCLMISGLPGLGKSKIVKYLITKSNIDMISLNGISLNSEDKAYLLLAQHFDYRKDKNISPLQFLENRFKSAIGQPTVILLDQIDQLLFNQHQSFLYNILQWTGVNSDLALIGISNNVSFEALLNAKQKSRLSSKQVLFRTYSPREMAEIIEFKLKKSKDIFQEQVLLYAAHEVSNFSSDVRRMIKVCVEALKNAQKDSTKVELRHMKLALCDDRKLKLFLVANDFDKIVLIGLSNLIERGDRGKDSLDDLKAITEQLARTNKIDEKVDEFHILKSLSRMETNRWISFEKYSVFKKSEDKVRKVHIKDTLVSIEIEIEDFRKDPLIDKHFSLAKPNGQTI